MTSYNKFNLETQIIGIIGHPIRHTYSPLMHNISFELKNLNYIYLPFDVPFNTLKAAINGMVALGIKGFNITLPHKENIIQYLKNVSEEASVIGAVNTVVNDSGTLSGYNTDVYGITESLMPYKDELMGADNVTVVGAGGAARSAVYALIRNFRPKNINIINRTDQKAESLKEYFYSKMHFSNICSYELVPFDLVDVFKDSKLIINATSVGMSPNVDDAITTIPQSFTKGQIVFDFVYNPLQTKLLRIAEIEGATVIDGLKMLVYQGAKSFELWTGEEMPVEQILKALKLYISTN
ncbi:MAG: shikimate dehydrogenase [Bacteroidota bacterium]|jgi:shikimate dehydrogenase|nr:shikimate dehydrogenase [Ignavibacteria bacterium]MCU7499119.1 shikimate dehydrogenase [Ignavibacteria bacterium]MCU7513984.1 shikimate dehydrogenase [Ignavibacteria bacterium]MCU7521526.1 shikimate dehydrogenase [Ignavibacteria bacterium]MCU7525923.1 shikimate dehydrogenase [Ignavibacteria bacterium]